MCISKQTSASVCLREGLSVPRTLSRGLYILPAFVLKIVGANYLRGPRKGWGPRARRVSCRVTSSLSLLPRPELMCYYFGRASVSRGNLMTQ